METPNSWQLQEAKNKFSEVVNKAMTKGPQAVTRHGKEAVYVIDARTYRELEQKAGKKPKKTLAQFLLESNADLDMEPTRTQLPLRDVDLDD